MVPEAPLAGGAVYPCWSRFEYMLNDDTGTVMIISITNFWLTPLSEPQKPITVHTGYLLTYFAS